MNLDDVTRDLGLHVRDSVVITQAEPIVQPGPRIVWVNQAFCDITGYTADEAIGQTPRILQGPDTDPTALARIRANLLTWTPMREVVKNYTKAGEPFWVELDLKPIADEAGWYRYWVAVQRDVSDTVAREAALEQAREAAETANRMKSQFLANMSHEIRTPLNGVLGMAQLLALSELNTRQREAVDTILSSGRALLGLIEDVLDLAQVEAGRLILESEPVTARALMEGAADAVRGVTIAKGLDLRIEAGDGADAVFLIDARRARQVLINLAGNGAKFTDTGCVVLACERRGDAMVFEVRDSGPGVPEAMREVIFERFNQADGSLSRRHGGAGLGLSIAREIVTAAGGTLAVDDAAEGGARFTITLPFTPAPQHAEPGAAPARSACAGEAGRRALVIEDNAVNRTVVEDALSFSGWSVEIAERAEPGLEAWRSGRYDLVIMDRQMPGLNGEAAIRRLRSEEAASAQARRTPVIMLTAHAGEGARLSALDAGADAYLAKPLDLAALIELADQLTARPAS